jgi:hypothetical protein
MVTDQPIRMLEEGFIRRGYRAFLKKEVEN